MDSDSDSNPDSASLRDRDESDNLHNSIMQVPHFTRHLSALIVDPVLAGDRIRLSQSVLEEILNKTSSSSSISAASTSSSSSSSSSSSKFYSSINTDHIGFLPSPLLFEILNNKSNIKVFGSVMEFTAESADSIELGCDLAESLLSFPISTDSLTGRKNINVDFQMKLVSLPKCQYLKISPMEASYIDIPDIRYF